MQHHFFADWPAKAAHASRLDLTGTPWPAWSTGETLAAALILNRADILADPDYTEDQALDRLRHDLGASPAEARAFFAHLRQLV